MVSHNPYFNRWFSAIHFYILLQLINFKVTILILIDGFLQYKSIEASLGIGLVTILILIDGFLQSEKYKTNCFCICVTILILIDGFLQ